MARLQLAEERLNGAPDEATPLLVVVSRHGHDEIVHRVGSAPQRVGGESGAVVLPGPRAVSLAIVEMLLSQLRGGATDMSLAFGLLGLRYTPDQGLGAEEGLGFNCFDAILGLLQQYDGVDGGEGGGESQFPLLASKCYELVYRVLSRCDTAKQLQDVFEHLERRDPDFFANRLGSNIMRPSPRVKWTTSSSRTGTRVSIERLVRSPLEKVSLYPGGGGLTNPYF